MDTVTQWLKLWHGGDAEAIERVTELVYDDLRRRAAYHMKGESNVTSLQPTALVHEVYLRMSSLQLVDWESRKHFISVVTTMMRRILVDQARARKAAKRDPGEFREDAARSEDHRLDVLAIDDALQHDHALSPLRQSGRTPFSWRPRLSGDRQYHGIVARHYRT